MKRIACSILLLTACGDDTAVLPDADDPGPDAEWVEGEFGCVGEEWPTTAPDPLEMVGKVVNRVDFGVGEEPIGGATVEIYTTSDELLGQATSTGGLGSSAGNYAVDIATGGEALLLYRKATATGYLDHYATEPHSRYDSAPYLHEMQTAAARDSYYQAVGVTRDPSKGTLQMFFYDCRTSPDDTFIAGITIEPPAGSTAVYFDEGWNLDTSLTETTSGGQVLLLNVEPGEIDIPVHAGGLTYRSWPVVVHQDAWDESVRVP